MAAPSSRHLVNLIDNAIKHSARGQVVRVGLEGPVFEVFGLQCSAGKRLISRILQGLCSGLRIMGLGFRPRNMKRFSNGFIGWDRSCGAKRREWELARSLRETYRREGIMVVRVMLVRSAPG